jgi:hypothetical protein
MKKVSPRRQILVDAHGNAQVHKVSFLVFNLLVPKYLRTGNAPSGWELLV